MVHYNVWFNFRDGIEEDFGLEALGAFLHEICPNGGGVGFRVLRNSSEAPHTQLPRFNAVIEFPDDAALSHAIESQRQRGIHSGSHGRILDLVKDFRVEIFRLVSIPVTGMQYACEI
jgi:hypothetical protein